MASWIQMRAERLRAVVEAYDEGVKDPNADRDALWRRFHGEALQMVRKSWGAWSHTSPLQGGDIWDALDAADAELGAARGAGDKGLDFAQLAYMCGRVTAVIWRDFRNLDDAIDWYDEASDIEKRALQDLGPDILPKTASGTDARLGGFLATLAADRERAVSPGLPAAQAAKDALVVDVYGLWESSKAAARSLEGGAVNHDITRILGGVEVATTFVPTGDEAGVYARFSKRAVLNAPAGVQWYEPTGELIGP